MLFTKRITVYHGFLDVSLPPVTAQSLASKVAYAIVLIIPCSIFRLLPIRIFFSTKSVGCLSSMHGSWIPGNTEKSKNGRVVSKHGGITIIKKSHTNWNWECGPHKQDGICFIENSSIYWGQTVWLFLPNLSFCKMKKGESRNLWHMLLPFMKEFMHVK